MSEAEKKSSEQAAAPPKKGWRQWLDAYFYDPNSRLPGLLVLYTLVCCLSLVLAFLFRFDLAVPPRQVERLLVGLWWVVPVELILLYLFGQFHGLLGFFGVQDLQKLFLSLFVASGVQLGVGLVCGGSPAPPRGVILANFVITFVSIGGLRLSLRMVREKWFSVPRGIASKKVHDVRVGIIGADETGAQLAAELLARTHRGLQPVVFLDDDKSKHGLTIHGIPVTGPISKAEQVVYDGKLEKMIIAMPSASHKRIREVVELLTKIGVDYVTVPGMSELLREGAKVTALRPVQIRDVLGRDDVKVEVEELRSLIQGKLVVVTGAGGSIGSELCRQILSLDPLKLLMVEQSEGLLFQIEQEMRQAGYGRKFYPVIADVCDEGRIGAILEWFQPQIIFHAAAHKHVPMMEAQPSEALKNNSLGTLKLAELAVKFGVRRFVLVSTDKAIRPTNVMGASKRLAEMILQDQQRRLPYDPSTLFISVRFGNVLGSSGSVVPIFEKQIAAGGPVTVTHPEVKRYFMTIPEAAGLVLQAAALGKGGDILILDMGEPIRIVDLARQMIALHGLKEEEDVEIKFVGLRPGEKLYEELNYEFEKFQSTAHPKISRLSSSTEIDSEKFREQLEELSQCVEIGYVKQIKRKLQEIVPDYQPQGIDFLK